MDNSFENEQVTRETRTVHEYILRSVSHERDKTDPPKQVRYTFICLKNEHATHVYVPFFKP